MGRISYFYLFIYLSISGISTFSEELTEKKTGINGLSFTLKEYIESAIRENPEFKISFLDLRKGEANKDYLNNYYIPTIEATPSFNYNDTPSTKSYEGVDNVVSKEIEYDLSLNQNTPLGSNVELSFNNLWLKTNDASTTLNPKNDNSLSLSFKQPLLKDLIYNPDITKQKSSKIEYLIELKKHEKTITKLISELAKNYWEFYSAKESLKLREESFRMAMQQHAFTQEQIDKGVLPPIDIYIVEENFVRNESELENAKKNYASKKATFLQYTKYGENYNDALEVNLVENPEKSLVIAERAEILKEKLYLNFPEYQIAKFQLDILELEYKSEKNQLLPNLDFSLSFSLNGLTNNYKESMNQISEFNNYGAFIGFTLKSPVVYSYLKEKVYIGELSIQRLKEGLKKIEQNMLLELNDKILELELNEKKFNLKRKIAELSLKKLNAENEKYMQGLSTINDIVLFQRDLAESKNNQNEALINWHISYNNLYEMTGDLKDIYGIKL